MTSVLGIGLALEDEGPSGQAASCGLTYLHALCTFNCPLLSRHRKKKGFIPGPLPWAWGTLTVTQPRDGRGLWKETLSGGVAEARLGGCPVNHTFT